MCLLIADIARDRIDTGLYGTEVYGVQSLRAADDAHAPAGKKSLVQDVDSRTTDNTSSELPAAITVDERNVVDLVVDDGKLEGGLIIKRTSQA